MMKSMRIFNLLCVAFVLLIVNCSINTKNEIPTEKYSWKNVQIVGGGFVSGFVYHPTEKDLVYARTDMGGAYRRDPESKTWIPLMDWVSYEDVNLMGIESIALDPNDPDKLYLACGTYTFKHVPNGEILYSDNRGATFRRTPVPFKMGGNENGRGNGERMTVDPNNGNILYLGTRHDGLWKSTDGAQSWSKIESFPDIKETMPDSVPNRYKAYWSRFIAGNGIVVVLCDPNSGEPGTGSSDIYVLVSLKDMDNFFRSTDGGRSWKPVPGHPRDLRPNHAVLAKDGIMYISYGTVPGPMKMTDGAIYKYNIANGEWTDITPEKPQPLSVERTMGYASVAVDPQNLNTIVACTFYRSRELGGEEIFRSTDGGQTWKGVFANGGTFDNSKAPYLNNTGIHWLFDFEIDPHNPDHVIFITGYGGHETSNFTDLNNGKPIVWSVISIGIEESVPLELLSPPKGAKLITAIGDYGGFVHWDLDKPVPEGNFVNPHFGNTDGVACGELNPNVIVRVGIETNRSNTGCNIGYSLDLGKTWQPTGSMPSEDSKHGHIAVSANGNIWIWTPQKSKPFLTTDMGNTWKEITELPKNTRIIADKVNPNRFYGVDILNGVYYYSIDGGYHFDSVETGIDTLRSEMMGRRGDPRGGQDRIYATPGIENELWIAAFDGLYLKPVNADGFRRIPDIFEIHAFGFGKGAPDSDYPAIYLVGIIKGHQGIFRSDDKANSWVRINDDEHQWGMILHITGDPKKYGRVYVGTHGRGVIYGDPNAI